MSIDASFSRATFPALKTSAQDAVELSSRASGHAAGYAAGLRIAAEETAAHAVRQEAALAEAIASGEVRIDAAVATVRAAAEALNQRTIPVLAEAQDALAATAIELAEAIIGRELSVDHASATSAVHRALAGVELALVHTVRLNPDDLADLDHETVAATGVTFTADASLGRGDAVTHFADGYLDARISAALDRARAAILEVGP